MPVAAQALTWGQVQVGHTDLTIEWHAGATIDVEMIRTSIASASWAPLQRDGADIASGTLELAEDGTYHGELESDGRSRHARCCPARTHF